VYNSTWFSEMPRVLKRGVQKRRFRGGSARQKILQDYEAYFKRAKRVVGHGKTTSNIELEKALDYLALRPNKVCTECDVAKMKDSGTLPPFVIANTMCKPPGQHWVAYYKGYKYDPLGKDSSKSAEQNDVETNCGQRCVAYLEMCKKRNKTMTF
jgi:hypothetical protein